MEEIDYFLYGKIVCAALLKDNKIYYTFSNHGTIFPLEEKGVLRHAKMGFVTENGFFVDRVLGLELARYFDQIEFKTPPEDELFSEDLKKSNEDVKVYRKEYSYICKKLK